MPRLRTSTAPATHPRLDRTGAGGMQGGQPAGEVANGDDWSEGAIHRGRLRVRTLVTLRWLVVAGEALLLGAAMALGFSAPFVLCFAVVAAGAAVNLLTAFTSPGQRV